MLATVAAALPGQAAGEQASEPGNPVAGYLTSGHHHSCALRFSAVRCWGFGGNGQLGYGTERSVGDDETPGSAGALDLGFERSAIAISAGNVHTCALLDDGTVRCWGFGGNGRLGYGSQETIGDDEPPGSGGPVNLGPGRTAKAISAGDGHTCAILDNDTVRCWGYGFDGRLGYNNTQSIGDDPGETPATAGPVNFGPGLTAKAISAGGAHTCAILNNDTVRCWGFAGAGRLGYGTAGCFPAGTTPAPPCPVEVGRGCFQLENPCKPDPAAPRTDTVGPVNLGPGRTARAISAGQFHTCAVLDDRSVRCWGTGGGGRLGYGNEESIGDNETPGAAGPVNLGRPARAVSAGGDHTCAVLDDGSVRCWGFGAFGQLGYANTEAIGDNEPPSSVGPVDLGTGRSATAVSAALYHTCVRLDDANESVRCWGYGANGRLGYCNERTIGDDETPGTTGPVDLGAGSAGAQCAARRVVRPPPAPSGSYPLDPGASGAAAEAARLKGLRSCLAKVRRHARRDVRRARALSGGRRVRARRHARRHRAQLRRRCLKRYGRTPGRVTGVSARAVGGRKIVLTFKAVGSDSMRPPPARSYLVKQSRRPIRTRRAFRRATSLCKGKCRFNISRVGANLTLTVTGLRRRSTYYFSIAARDNVSKRLGPRSSAVRARVR